MKERKTYSDIIDRLVEEDWEIRINNHKAIEALVFQQYYEAKKIIIIELKELFK